ncbi:MAG TPA: hypothetical protein DEO83_05035 [Lachnospiraceae bacterium]|nr:hypothetical protein [Lachnospiraceae bacterium]
MQKKFFIISLVILFGILGVLIFIGIRSSVRNNDLVSNSDYPFRYVMKEGNLVITLDGHKTPKLKWEAEIQNTGVVQVFQKGKEFRGKAKFIVTPVGAGSTRVNFVRSVDIAGTKVDVATVTVPVYISDAMGVNSLSTLENPYLVKGPDVIGETTANPVIINNSVLGNQVDATPETENAPGTIKGDIFFANGKGDWILESLDGNTDFEFYNDGIKDYAVVKKSAKTNNNQNLSEGALVKNAEIALSSQSLKITRKLKAEFRGDGTVRLSLIASE